jgi:hypothetical protein
LLTSTTTVADRMSKAQTQAIWRAVAEARAGKFDALVAHA